VLSAHRILYPRIDAIHEASSLTAPIEAVPHAHPPAQGNGNIALPSPAPAVLAFSQAARQRRSALDFRGGAQSIRFDELAALLDAAAAPMEADFASRFVSLHLYVHRVEGLEPGVYRHWPATRSLENRKSGDQRLMAAGLSLGQDLAANCAVAFSMVADLERAARAFGGRAYRYGHFEAGHIGQRLYIAAERHGLQCTGIGAFYDDAVHRYLEVEPTEGQVIYHFACGYAVHDPRLDAQEIGT
jgi:SagB-type dehydrogenase family enzyme